MSAAPLAARYAARVERLDADAWHAIAGRFADVSLYQALPYARVRWPRAEVSHLVLTRDDEIVAAVQVSIKRVPLLGGIAYVRWGPLWRLRGRSPDPAVLGQVLRAIRQEYVVRRGLLVRILPREVDGDDAVTRVYVEAGFQPRATGEATLLLDLGPPLPALRAGLAGSWRNNLKRAEQGALVFTEGTDPALFDRFAPIHAEMTDRKRLVDLGDVEVYRRIQELLPAEWRMRVVLCSGPDGTDVAGAITSALGDTALAILWATNPRGRDLRASFALQWRVLDALKADGCRHYDLGGIDRAANPGGHLFKSGLSGRNGREARFLGAMEQSARPVLPLLLAAALSLRTASRRLRGALKGALAPPRRPAVVPDGAGGPAASAAAPVGGRAEPRAAPPGRPLAG
jgi:hypothetical protein